MKDQTRSQSAKMAAIAKRQARRAKRYEPVPFSARRISNEIGKRGK